MNKEKPAASTATGAILLLGAVFYLLWCARSFILAPAIAFPPDLPKETRNVILHWHRTARYFRPQPFTWKTYLYALKHPGARTDTPVSVMPLFPWMVLLTHRSRLGMSVWFTNRRGGDVWDIRIDSMIGEFRDLPSESRPAPEEGVLKSETLMPGVRSTD